MGNISCNFSRGDVCLVAFNEFTDKNVQKGCRPAVIIGNNIGNKHSPILLVTPITSKTRKANMPTHVKIPSGEAGLPQDSIVLAEQIHTISKEQVQKKMGTLSRNFQDYVDEAVKISLAL